MAANSLVQTDREAVWAQFMRDESTSRTPIGVLKASLLDAVGAADDWVEANQASFNAALPAAARNGLTTRQKAMLLMFVVRRRYEVT